MSTSTFSVDLQGCGGGSMYGFSLAIFSLRREMISKACLEGGSPLTHLDDRHHRMAGRASFVEDARVVSLTIQDPPVGVLFGDF